jgi:hypothetical protein
MVDGGLPRPAFENSVARRDNRRQGRDRTRQCESVTTINNEWYSPFRAMASARLLAGDVPSSLIASPLYGTLNVTAIFSCVS